MLSATMSGSLACGCHCPRIKLIGKRMDANDILLAQNCQRRNIASHTDPGRDARNCRVVGNICGYQAVRRDQDAVTNRDRIYDFGPSTDQHPVPDTAHSVANHNTRLDGAIFPHLHRRYENAVNCMHHKARTNLCLRGNVDAGQHLCKSTDDHDRKPRKMAQDRHTDGTHPMTESVTQDCEGTGLQKNSEALVQLIGTNVLLAGGTDIGANILEHIPSIRYGRSATSVRIKDPLTSRSCQGSLKNPQTDWRKQNFRVCTP